MSWSNAGWIYPAHAGINLSAAVMLRLGLNLPRTRGDKPLSNVTEHSDLLSTPHTRG